MNLIESQASDFYREEYREANSYKDFIKKVRWQLNEYNKYSHRLVFINYIQFTLRKEYDKHLETCQYRDKDRMKCSKNKTFENTLFFVQNEIEDIESMLEPEAFPIKERASIIATLNKILQEIDTIKTGQEFTYDDFQVEFEELKDLLYLNKKPWTQLLIGKLSEMTASGVMSLTASQKIVEVVQEHYPELF